MSRILLIDDDAQVNEVVRATLEMLGHTVETAECAEAVAGAFDSFHPDMALVDYMLPGSSGLDVLKEIASQHPGTVSYLATGMADFGLLKEALSAGACSMLSKPYRLADLMGLMDTAQLLESALQQERQGHWMGGEVLTLEGQCGKPVSSLDIARLIIFARSHQADPDIAGRRLPLIAMELMRNAAIYGVSAHAVYSLELKAEATEFVLTVSDHGPGFDWQRVLARARSGMDRARATGLQLVMALADDLKFDADGRTACARLARRPR